MQRALDRSHSPIVRIDTPFDPVYPTNAVTVVKVLTSQTAAETGVSRLNQINADKSCTYFYCTSRLIEQSADAAKLV